MKQDIQSKKNILIRKNKGKALLDSYFYKVKEIFGISLKTLDLVDLNITDEIIKSKILKKESVYEVRYYKNNEKENLSVFEDYANKEILHLVSKKNYYVFLDNYWHYCGSFKIDAGCIRKINIGLNRFILNDLILISEDETSKIWIDYTESGIYVDIEFTIYEN